MSSMIVSASRIAKWDACQRRWAFHYLQDHKEPFAAAAQAGVETHKRLETGNIVPGEVWRGGGKTYPVGDAAVLLRAATPTGVVSHEEKFTVEIDGVAFTGTADGRGPGLILDYKTTSKRAYVKSKKALMDDPQRLLYTQVFQDAETCLWLYLPWADMEVVPRELPVERVRDREKFKLHVLKPAESMCAVPSDTDPLSLPPNKASCGLYPPAGCPHKNVCFPATKQVSMSQKSSRLFDTLTKDNPPEAYKPVTREADIDRTKAPAVDAEKLPDGGISTTSTAQFAIEILFIDCFPLGRLDAPLNFSHPLISRASADVADDQGVQHARLIDYNKGMDMLAVRMADLVLAAPVKYLHLETKSKEGAACMNPLMGISRLVVKGAY